MLSKLGLPSKPPPVARSVADSQPRFDDFEGLPVFGAVVFCAPEERPCTPKEGILAPGIGLPSRSSPKFPDRPGIENPLQISYALCFLNVVDVDIALFFAGLHDFGLLG